MPSLTHAGHQVLLRPGVWQRDWVEGIPGASLLHSAWLPPPGIRAQGRGCPSPGLGFLTCELGKHCVQGTHSLISTHCENQGNRNASCHTLAGSGDHCPRPRLRCQRGELKAHQHLSTPEAALLQPHTQSLPSCPSLTQSLAQAHLSLLWLCSTKSYPSQKAVLGSTPENSALHSSLPCPEHSWRRCCQHPRPGRLLSNSY